MLARRCGLYAVAVLLLTWNLAIISASRGPAAQSGARSQALTWPHLVRIGAYSLKSDNAADIVKRATEDGVFGIEVDNDIPGRYESFLDPGQKLEVIRQLASKAHAASNYAFVYIAGLECITAHADKAVHTLAKDHPDWLQRKITGEPAIFSGGTAFWIAPGDEDVWISPFASEWRKIYMQRVRQIAATGIDGLYVDIPYWMTHFDGWENSWVSFDDYTVAAFRKQTGLDARRDLTLGDFDDPNFRKWVDFRIETITDFMREIDQNAKSVNPNIKTIAEIYPGIEKEGVRVGTDVYQLYPVVDAIAHEYEFGGGDHMASSRTPLDWLRYQVGMLAFRSFADGKPTWILNYSWDGDRKIDPRDAMQNLAMSEIAAGANFWDAPGHVMAGSNDPATRRRILRWVADHQDRLYKPREPMDPVGVYFSPATRNYFADDFIPSFQGCGILLMQKHWEFQIVTPRNLESFRGNTLILPDVQILSGAERDALHRLLEKGKRLIITGQDATGMTQASPESQSHIVRFADDPCKPYMASLGPNLEHPETSVVAGLLPALEAGQQNRQIEITAAPLTVTHLANVDGVPHIFVANFNGLRGGQNGVPTSETGMVVKLVADKPKRLYFLPFLGHMQELHGQRQGSKMIFRVPPIDRGAVLWIEH